MLQTPKRRVNDPLIAPSQDLESSEDGEEHSEDGDEHSSRHFGRHYGARPVRSGARLGREAPVRAAVTNVAPNSDAFAMKPGFFRSENGRELVLGATGERRFVDTGVLEGEGVRGFEKGFGISLGLHFLAGKIAWSVQINFGRENKTDQTQRQNVPRTRGSRFESNAQTHIARNPLSKPGARFSSAAGEPKKRVTARQDRLHGNSPMQSSMSLALGLAAAEGRARCWE